FSPGRSFQGRVAEDLPVAPYIGSRILSRSSDAREEMP
uniref:Uncharacterized protein n=1 Tax=Ciona savignyi TaxID=51511 RepID=H2ZM91_CIOSA